MYNYNDLLTEYKYKQDLLSYIDLNLTFSSISDKVKNIQYIDNLVFNIAKIGVQQNDKDVLFNLKELCILIPDPTLKPKLLLDIISVKDNNLLNKNEILTEIENCLIKNPNYESSLKQIDLFTDTLFSFEELDRALNFIDKLQDKYLIANLYYALSMNYWNIKDYQTAKDLISKSFDISITIENPTNKLLMLRILAKAYATKYQNTDFAVKIWNLSLDIIQDNSGNNIIIQPYLEVLGVVLDAISYVNSNIVENIIQRALVLMDTITDETLKSYVYKEISDFLCYTTNLNCSKRILEKIYLSTLNFEEIINKCTILPNLAMLYDFLGDTIKTNEILNKSIEYIENLNCISSYVTAIQTLVYPITQLTDEKQIDNFINHIFRLISKLNESSKSNIYYNLASDLFRFKDQSLSKKYLILLLKYILEIEDTQFKRYIISNLMLSLVQHNDYSIIPELFNKIGFTDTILKEEYYEAMIVQNLIAIADILPDQNEKRKLLEFCISNKTCINDLTMIASSYIKTGELCQAKELLNQAICSLNEIEDKFFLQTSVHFIYRTVLDISDLYIVKEILDNLFQYIDNLADNDSKILFYIYIASGYKQIQDQNRFTYIIDKALQKINLINDQEQLSNVVANLSGELNRFENEDETVKILESFLEKTSIISETSIYRIILMHISNIAGNMKSTEQASVILQKVLNSSNCKSISCSSSAISNLIEAYSYLNEKEKAHLLLQNYIAKDHNFSNNNSKYDYYLNLAKAYYILDDYENKINCLNMAISLIEDASNPKKRISSYIKLANTYLFLSDYDKHEQTINECLSLAKSISDNYYFIIMMSGIAELYAYTNKQNKGKEIIDSLQERLDGIQDIILNTLLISKISKTLALLDYKDEAKIKSNYIVLNLVQMPDGNLNNQIFANLYTVFAILGEDYEAIKYLEYICLDESEFINSIADSQNIISKADQIFDLLYVSSKAGKSVYLLSLALLMPSIAKINPKQATKIIDYVANQFIS